MESITDIAKLFLSMESMTHKKLQKLCYYAQAWCYALTGKRLVADEFEAWVHGPVCRTLYSCYREWGWMSIPMYKGEVNIQKQHEKVVQLVFATYGHLTGDQLEALTHAETPWKKARAGCKSYEYCTNTINIKDMGDECLRKIGKS